MLVVGAPLRHRNRIYNCAVVVHRGRVLGVVPKSYLPTYREFYERRQLAPGDDVRGEIRVAGADVPFGPDLLFAADDVPGLVVHVEVCEDMWVPIPPSAEAALAGATVLAQPLRQPDHRRPRRGPQAAVPLGVARAAWPPTSTPRPGQGESTTDLAWDGQTMIYENGVLLAETRALPRRRPARGRRRRPRPAAPGAACGWGRSTTTAARTPRAPARSARVGFTLDPPDGDLGLRRAVERFPFVPADADRLDLDCYEAYNIQVAGLQQRLRAIGDPKVVIGVSGGLDSTHALIVAAQAMDRAGRPRSDILGFTLPGLRDQRAARRPTRTG